MSAIFLKVCNLSLTASWIVLALLLLRPFLQKVPRWIHCLTWGIVALRLLLPFSVESVLSLIPSAATFPEDIMMAKTPMIDSGVDVIDRAVNPIFSEVFAPEPLVSANPLQILFAIAANVWVLGILLTLIWGIVSYIRLALRVRASVCLRDRSYECDDIETPFILGVFSPRIYLPSGMSEEQIEYVIRHEKAHLERKDHVWKLLGFFLLAIHWFNPLLWIAYVLFCRDIEMACDEKVIRNMSDEEKKGYSETLLFCSFHRHRVFSYPLAFGEIDVKHRIRSVLYYKKRSFWVVFLALLVCALFSICFLTNPVGTRRSNESFHSFLSSQIMSYHQNEKSKDFYCCANYEILGKKTRGDEITVYLWVRYCEYGFGNEIKEEHGSHIPSVITVRKESDSDYQLVEYWIPRDGSYYVDDIREKFPVTLWLKALRPMRYSEKQGMICDNMAKAHFSSSYLPYSSEK